MANDTAFTAQALEITHAAYKKWNIAVTLPQGPTLTGRTLTFTLKVGATTIVKDNGAHGGITIVNADAGTATLEIQASDTEALANATKSGYEWDLWIDDKPQPIAKGTMKIL